LELFEGQDAQKLKGKRRMKEKVQKPIVESLHLNTMAISYNTHFLAYFSVKKQVTQLILMVVW